VIVVGEDLPESIGWARTSSATSPTFYEEFDTIRLPRQARRRCHVT
jgi:hypothetical protein